MLRTFSLALALAAVSAAPVRADSGPLQLQPAKPVSSAKIVGSASAVDPAVVLAKANAFFSDSGTIIADFVQIGGDGRRSDGKLFVERPGRMRFAYAPPATLEVVADGSSVAVIDRKLHTQDLYFIGQTPLKFLLSDHIDLAHDTKLLDVSGDGNGASVEIEDKETFGGTSKVRLTFDMQPFTLRQWTVTDPQGYETVVSLSNIDLNTKPDPALFTINTERMLNTRK